MSPKVALIIIFLVIIIAYSLISTRRRNRKGRSPWTSDLLEGFVRRRLGFYPYGKGKESSFFHNPRTGGAIYTGNSHAEALSSNDLPFFETGIQLAQAMGISEKELRWLCIKEGNHYYEFGIPKANGKSRTIRAPKTRMKSAQRWALTNILEKIPAHPACHGFRKERSIVTNAAHHTDKEVVFNTDLKDFFDTITYRRVVGMFISLGYSRELALILGRMCTHRGRLPQGAPTSPAITNIICRGLDARLTGLGKKFNASYTRYADDITFSGSGQLRGSLKRFIPLVKAIIKDEGFIYSREKTHITRKGNRQIVTGLVVNKKPNVSKKDLDRFRAIVHNCKIHGPESQNQSGHEDFRGHLYGYANFVRMVNPVKGEKLLNELDSVQW